MFPFASHEKYGYNLEFAAEELKAAGDLAKKYGHRLTMHPGQVGKRLSARLTWLIVSLRKSARRNLRSSRRR